MPIEYSPNAAWPPSELAAASRLYDEYGAWYRGDPEELWRYYSGQPSAGYPTVRPSQRAGGVYGFLSRLFWGRPASSAFDATHFHIPAASDISALSSDLLFAEQPQMTVIGAANTVASDRLQEILSEHGGYPAMSEGKELASAYGGCYLRASVDATVADAPILEVIPPDCAIPEWRYGRLTAVTFWRVLPSLDGSQLVWRHLERHEVVGGLGYVFHALYQGNGSALGQRVSLMDHAETRHYAELVDEAGAVATGATRLAVAYWPNVRPNRELKGSPLGRSHYQGALSAMDGLDATWSSWMRDLDLAKARLVVPKEYLRSLGAGAGATFNPDQQIFVGVSGVDPDKPLQITMSQFAIRVDEHERTAAGHWRTIVRAAGYSADAFGEEASGAQATATEVGQRGARTIATRGKEIGYARPALRHICEVLLELDATHFGTRGVPAGADLQVRVEFPDGVSADIEKQARTVQLLDAAAAVSLRTKISMAHPDWDDDQIEAEAKAIEDEKEPVAVQDPAAFTGDEPLDPATTDDRGNDGDSAGDDRPA